MSISSQHSKPPILHTSFHSASLISITLALSRTPVYTVRPRATALCGVPVYAPAFAGTQCAYPWRDGQAELTWLAGYILEMVYPVTHPSSNQAQHGVTQHYIVYTKPPHRQKLHYIMNDDDTVCCVPGMSEKSRIHSLNPNLSSWSRSCRKMATPMQSGKDELASSSMSHR